MIKDIFTNLANHTTTTDALVANPETLGNIPLPAPEDAYVAMVAVATLFLRSVSGDDGSDAAQRRVAEMLTTGGFVPPHGVSAEPACAIGGLLFADLATRAEEYARYAEQYARSAERSAARGDDDDAEYASDYARQYAAMAAEARGDAPAPARISVWQVSPRYARGAYCLVPSTTTDAGVGNPCDTWWWCTAEHPERNERARIGEWRSGDGVQEWVDADSGEVLFYALAARDGDEDFDVWHDAGIARVAGYAAR